jgi:hypothetical protein
VGKLFCKIGPYATDVVRMWVLATAVAIVSYVRVGKAAYVASA